VSAPTRFYVHHREVAALTSRNGDYIFGWWDSYPLWTLLQDDFLQHVGKVGQQKTGALSLIEVPQFLKRFCAYTKNREQIGLQPLSIWQSTNTI
jgi:hypothetical protein